MLGVGYLKIHMGKSAAHFDPKLTIKCEYDNIWSIKMESNLKTKEITFVDKEEFATSEQPLFTNKYYKNKLLI